ncbi:hypothetical protein CHS0354_016053 [Potamilus streckersoni]|uniref:Proline-rich transmembrane protein 3/4 domain-containing protein n=1 Tax=Potamilus streckersoni TaxID=2493646 RepID=A0AAE0W655_9BIVA|nr:hypothetical protein CHS0354_016053 [Potamilus streckersoni]
MGLIVTILMWISILTMTLKSGYGQNIVRSHDRQISSKRHNSRMIHESILFPKYPSKNKLPLVTKESGFHDKKSDILNNFSQIEQIQQPPNGDLHGRSVKFSTYMSVEVSFKEEPSQSHLLHGLVEPVQRRRFKRDAINHEKREVIDLHQPVVKEEFSGSNDLVFQNVNETGNPVYQVTNISDKNQSLYLRGSEASITQSILVTKLVAPLVASSFFSIAPSVGALRSKICTSVLSDSDSVTFTSSVGNINSGTFTSSIGNLYSFLITSSIIDSNLDKFIPPKCDADSNTLTSFFSVSSLKASASSSKTLMPFIETSSLKFISDSLFTSSQFSNAVNGDFPVELHSGDVHIFPSILYFDSSAISLSPISTNKFDTSQDSEKNLQETKNIPIYSCQKCIFQIKSSTNHFSTYLDTPMAPSMSALPTNTSIHSIQNIEQLIAANHSSSVSYDTDSRLVHKDILHPLEMKSISISINPVQTRVREATHSVSVTYMSASQKYLEIITNFYKTEMSVSVLASSFESASTESLSAIRVYKYESAKISSVKQIGTDMLSGPVESIYSSDYYQIFFPFTVSSEDFLHLMASLGHNFTHTNIMSDTSSVSNKATYFWNGKISSSAAFIEPTEIPEPKPEVFITTSFSSVGYNHNAFDSSSVRIDSFQTQQIRPINPTSSRTTHLSLESNTLSETIDILSSMDLPTPELLVSKYVLTSEPIQSALFSESKIPISLLTTSSSGTKTQIEIFRQDDSSDRLILHASETIELSSTFEMTSESLHPTKRSELEKSSLEPEMPTPEPEPPSTSTEFKGTPEPEAHSSIPDKPSLKDTKPTGISEPEAPTPEFSKPIPDQAAEAKTTYEQHNPTSEPNKHSSEPHIPEPPQNSGNAFTDQPEVETPSSEPETKLSSSDPEGKWTSSEPHSEPPTTEPKGDPSEVTESEPETNPITIEPHSKPPTSEPEHQSPTSEPGHFHPEPEPETFAEPQPAWDIAKELWKEAWEIHIYFFGPTFILLGMTCVATIIRLWKMEHLLSKHYFLTLNILVILVCFFRGLYLLVDAYNSRNIYPRILDFFLYSIVFPCLTSMFSILFYALLLATRVQALSKKVQKLWVLLAIIFIHFALSITTDVIVGLYATAGLLLLICQFFFVLWGLLLFVGYILIFRRLYISAAHRHKIMVAHTAAEYKVNGVYKKNDLKEHKNIYTLSLAIKVTFASAFFGFACVGLELYGMFGVYGILKRKIPDPWPWWTYHTLLRSMELLMCISIAYVAAQPLKYLYKKEQGHTFFYLLPCKLLFCDRDSAYRSEGGFSSSSVDHMHLSDSSNESHSASRKCKLGKEKDIMETEKARYEKTSLNAFKNAGDSEVLTQDATLPNRERHKKSMLIVEDGFVRIRREDEMSSITEQEFDTYSRSTDLISGSRSQSNSHIQRSYDGTSENNISLCFPSNDEFSQSDHANKGVVMPLSWQIPFSHHCASDLNTSDIVLSLSMSDLANEMDTELRKAFQSKPVSDVDLISNISLPVTLECSTSSDNQYNVDFYQDYHDKNNTPQTSPSVDNSANHSSAISTTHLLQSKYGKEDPGIRKKLFDSG